ncbi:MAG: hypothetical protein N3D10_04310, partial [Candidatus Micrarchaeota archaeon]|nr:hypothetical protein [Candidatus Micrarchaeota archaeon]
SYHNLDGLVIVTASHNPPEWNALKFVDNAGVAISSTKGQEICNFLNKPFKPPSYLAVGQHQELEIVDKYIDAVLSFVKKFKLKKLKVVLDCGNGTSALVLPKILNSLGMDVVVLHSELDGTFPSRPSEPSEENLTKLISKVKELKADFGIALDGDADRITFVDEKGNWIVGDKCLAILEKFILQEQSPSKKYVITTYATSKVVEKVAEEFNAKTIYTDVGAPYLSEKIFQFRKECYIAGEEVGGIAFPDFSIAKDGPLAAAVLCAAVTKQPLSSWVEQLPKFFNYKTKIAIKAEEKSSLSTKFFKKIKNKYSNIIQLKNGFRIELDGGWVLFRVSGTENFVRIFAEARSSSSAEQLAEEFVKIFKSVKSKK